MDKSDNLREQPWHEQLRSYRKQRGASQTWLAQQLNQHGLPIDQSMLSHWELRGQHYRIDVPEFIADILELQGAVRSAFIESSPNHPSKLEAELAQPISWNRQLQIHRLLGGFTQDGLGEVIGVTKRSIGVWESSGAPQDVEIVKQLADALKLSGELRTRFLDSHPTKEKALYSQIVSASRWGEKLTKHIALAEITRDELAERIGIPPLGLSAWQRSLSLPETEAQAVGVADALSLTGGHRETFLESYRQERAHYQEQLANAERFGDILRLLRPYSEHPSLNALGESLDPVVSRELIRFWESGQTLPGREHMLQLVDRLGLDSDASGLRERFVERWEHEKAQKKDLHSPYGRAARAQREKPTRER